MSYLVVSTNESVGSALKTLGHSIIRGLSFSDNPGYQRFKSIYNIEKIKSQLIKKLESLKISGKLAIKENSPNNEDFNNWNKENSERGTIKDGFYKSINDRKEASSQHQSSITPFKITAMVPILKGYAKNIKYSWELNGSVKTENRPQYYILFITFDTEKIYNVSTRICSGYTRDPQERNRLFCKNEKLIQINDPGLIQLLNSCKK